MRYVMASSGKERFSAQNTLSVLLIAMRNQRVQVEMKNESIVNGTLLNSDGFGNLLLSNTSLITIQGKMVKANEMHVKASAVRYVHLPDAVNPLKAIKNELSRKKRPPQMPAKYRKVEAVSTQTEIGNLKKNL